MKLKALPKHSFSYIYHRTLYNNLNSYLLSYYIEPVWVLEYFHK